MYLKYLGYHCRVTVNIRGVIFTTFVDLKGNEIKPNNTELITSPNG